MAFYIYIHGFNSGRESRSGAMLQKLLGAPVFRPVNDYSKPFQECLADLSGQILNNAPKGESLTVMGTSLGAFYALQLRLAGIARIAAWNPVIFPALQLAAFVGKNTRFTDNQDWIFPESSLLSYAAAADPRQWGNFYLRSLGAGGGESPPERLVILGKNDELLNPELSRAYWLGHAAIMDIEAGHSVPDFEHALAFLQ